MTNRNDTGPVLAVGSIPPPFMGQAVATLIMLNALSDRVRVLHVDTTDHRSIFTSGRLDTRNAVLACLHAGRLLRLLITRRPRFVYVPLSQVRWGYVRDAVFMLLARATGAPIVIHLHGADFRTFYHEASFLERAMIRVTLRWVALALVLTPRLRTNFEGFVPAERVVPLPNAIADPWPRGLAPVLKRRVTRAKATPDELRVLFMANLQPSKGATTVVRALAEPGLSATTLRIVGEPGPGQARALADLARRLGVHDRVQLCGPRLGRDKLLELERADVFVYPTERDGQPLVILEAMAAGLPIVSSACGAIPETLSGTGLLVPPATPQQIASCLRRLIAAPELRRELGSKARERFTECYTIESFGRRLDTLLPQLWRVVSAEALSCAS